MRYASQRSGGYLVNVDGKKGGVGDSRSPGVKESVARDSVNVSDFLVDVIRRSEEELCVLVVLNILDHRLRDNRLGNELGVRELAHLNHSCTDQMDEAILDVAIAWSVRQI